MADDEVATPLSTSIAPPRVVDNMLTAAPSQQIYAEAMFAASGRTLKALAILSLGLLNDDGSPVFNPSVLPWSKAQKPTTLTYIHYILFVIP